MKAQARNFSFTTFVVMTSSERMTFDIIGWHFTANMSNLFNICYHLDYGHLTVSSVSHTLSYLLRPVTISKLTTTNRFSKRLILGWINRALHVSKLKCSAGVLYECIIEKNRPSSEKHPCHFHFVFPVMPDKVALESTAPLPRKALYLPLQQRLLLVVCICIYKSAREKPLSVDLYCRHLNEFFCHLCTCY